jgi:uncharacterized membrane protein
MAVLVFWMGRNALNSDNPLGIMSESRRRMLWAVVFVLLFFLYGVTFNHELRANPFVATTILFLLFALAGWQVSKWRSKVNRA